MHGNRDYEINIAIAGYTYDAVDFQEVPKKDFPRREIRREQNSVQI